MEMTFSLDEIGKPAALILDLMKESGVVAFHGEMGAGKTTLIREICARLGSSDAVASPTFSLINQYDLPGNRSVFHLDLYRLRSAGEAVDAGLADCLYSGEFCFVEWPDQVTGLLPDDTLHCYLSTVSEDKRKLQINL